MEGLQKFKENMENTNRNNFEINIFSFNKENKKWSKSSKIRQLSGLGTWEPNGEPRQHGKTTAALDIVLNLALEKQNVIYVAKHDIFSIVIEKISAKDIASKTKLNIDFESGGSILLASEYIIQAFPWEDSKYQKYRTVIFDHTLRDAEGYFAKKYVENWPRP